MGRCVEDGLDQLLWAAFMKRMYLFKTWRHDIFSKRTQDFSHVLMIMVYKSAHEKNGCARVLDEHLLANWCVALPQDSAFGTVFTGLGKRIHRMLLSGAKMRKKGEEK